jgi:hypothetical protein
MTHDWFPASGGGLIATMWMANPLKVALLKSTYSPNPDTHKVWADIAAQEIVGTGYTAGGQALAGKAENYDAAQDRTNLVCADNTWTGATFQTAFAAIYDDSGAKPLWSLVNFEAVKDVTAGVFTIDWQAVGTLYVTKA